MKHVRYMSLYYNNITIVHSNRRPIYIQTPLSAPLNYQGAKGDLSTDPRTIMTTDVKNRIIDRLSSDLQSCDCHVTLFLSALASYRHDTVLKPFPPQYVLEDGTKDIEQLVNIWAESLIIDR